VAGAIDAVRESFPVLATVGGVFRRFHSIMMGDSTGALDGFLAAYKDSMFKPFCEGIKKDIAAVKNAISLSVSSGFVEGCNNKFKLIKRSLYGRSGFVNPSRNVCSLSRSMTRVSTRGDACAIVNRPYGTCFHPSPCSRMGLDGFAPVAGKAVNPLHVG
jgi:hypothetical protein